MRVKRGVTTHKRHQKIRKATKGMTRGNRSSVRRGKQALTKALVYATRDRKNRKRTMRALWNTRINAAARSNGTSYSKLIAGLKNKNIAVDRKILSELAVKEPKVFAEVVKTAIK
ncbi:MAG TPA: 50S ribosomal protein L20 [Candidatus Saccharimonadales bacterium]|nr:50S ribosomal protein L20 [Candidatus Saccharimonadales bacterium]